MTTKLILDRRSMGKSFTRGFYNALANGMPNVEVGDVRGVDRAYGFRQAFVVEYGGKRVMIHSWDYTGAIHKLTPDDVDLVLCVQYNEGLKDCAVPVVPWTMFASDQINFYSKIDQCREIVAAQEKLHNIGFSGRMWQPRKAFWRLSGDQWFYCENTGRQATGVGTLEDYMRKLGSWRRCLILYGRGSRINASHNRRENECAALGVPMVMNYEPEYYVPFRAGEHYTLIENPTDLLRYEHADTLTAEEVEQVKAAREYWEQNMSVYGVCRLFRQICEERL